MQKSLWTDITVLLEEFVKYMDGDHLDSYASNCKNAGYTREGGGQHFFKHNEGDELICTLMTGALYFMNENRWRLWGGNMVVSNDDELKEYVRCAIVNIFMHILLASPCRSEMGVYYAWDTVTQMEGLMGGLITEGKCKRGVFLNIKTQEFDMEKQITTWLNNNPSLTEKIEGPAIKSTCNKKLPELGAAPEGTHAMDDKIQLQTTQTHVIQQLTPETTVLVREVPPQLMQPAPENGVSTQPTGDATSTDIDDDVHESTEPNTIASGTQGPNGADEKSKEKKENTDEGTSHGKTADAVDVKTSEKDKTSGKGSTGLSGTQGGRSGPTKAGETRSPKAGRSDDAGKAVTQPAAGSPPQAPASPVLPARPPPPPPPRTSQGEGTGSTGENGAKGDAAPAPPAETTSSTVDDASDKGKSSTRTTAETTPGGPQPPTAPPAAPPQEAGTPAAPGAAGKSKEPKAKDSDATSAGKAPCPRSNGKSTGVSINCGRTTDEELGETEKVKQLLQGEQQEKVTNSPNPNSGTGNTESTDTESKNGTEAGSAQPPAGPAPAATPPSPEQGTSGPSSTPAPDQPADPGAGPSSATPAAAGNTSDTKHSGGTDAVADGGNDDPPPLNPPKPKPNPNPDQSGSSGSFSDADLADGVSGGQGKGGEGGEKAAGGTGSGSAAGGGSTGGGGGRGAGGSGTDVVTPSVRPGVTWEDVKPYTPAIIPAAVGIGIIAFFLWKYFAYLAKRRRQFRTVRDVPSPPLDEDILHHLQRGDLPPPDYGYTIIRDRQPGRLPAARRRRPPRVNRRTLIELHLEVLNEREAAAWENVKDDYWTIVVEEFAQECAQDLMRDEETNNNILGVSTSDYGYPGTNVPSTDSDATDPCPPNDLDPWSCMETIQLHAPHSRAPTVPGDATSYCTHWINWIDRKKHILRQCTTQPWFLQLTADWKQYLREHMAANAASGEHRTAATMDRHKLDLWKQWVSQQHNHIETYSEEEWFQHLLHHVQQHNTEETGSQREQTFHLNNIPTAQAGATDAEAHHRAPENIPFTTVKHPQPQHDDHPELRHTQHFTAHKLCMLILASVIEECAVHSRLQATELYVDDLLEQL
ncbi:hypothetical protein AK88_05468 [Plasmodium fragile]|uniref:Schizont-infected cell agglutination C-terminal domain-containing protein n=1 Tax=Plasmodium fragile TaxID=5857 RepID=A0A0D9QD07_PLAFR|nr:uncharacterized protein AK88_05468 [Plasmodium fragile]KJP84898.1 hypothetical protein AK88_05468 [Plasmodium fragile]